MQEPIALASCPFPPNYPNPEDSFMNTFNSLRRDFLSTGSIGVAGLRARNPRDDRIRDGED